MLFIFVTMDPSRQYAQPGKLFQLRGTSIEKDSGLEEVRGVDRGQRRNQPEKENKSKKEKQAGGEGHGPM